MNKTFTEIEQGFKHLFPAIWNFIKGLFRLLFYDSIHDLCIATFSHWKKTKTFSERLAVIWACLLITCFIIYGLRWLYIDLNYWWNRDWYESVIKNNSQKEIESFFDKYNERFLAHDCEFMATVGADEAMYDKWWNIKYKDYKCEEWIRFQKKIILPIRIDTIEKTGDKLRTKWEAIVIFQNQWEPLLVRAIYFDLWKLDKWDLWHFNNQKSGPRDIDISIYKN